MFYNAYHYRPPVRYYFYMCLSVIPSTGGRIPACTWEGGVCIPACIWKGDVHPLLHYIPIYTPVTATEAGGTYPTGMHPCFK